MPSFDSKHNSERTGAYNTSQVSSGTVTESGVIVDAANAKELTFQLFISSDASSEMDLLQGFFEHSDDTNPANFTAIPVKNLIGDVNEFIINLDNQTIFYTASMGAFNTKRYVRTGFESERNPGGTAPLYWGIVKQKRLIRKSLGG